MEKVAARSGVKSCLRALEVVEYFVSHQAPARTTEISRALGIPNSSADEILRTLVGAGYLSYNRFAKLYSPSYKLVSTALAIARQFFAGDFVTRLLDDIRQETGATVFLTGQKDCWIEMVAMAQGDWDVEEGEIDYPTELISYRRDGNRWQPGTNFASAMLAQHSNVEIIEFASRAQKLGLGPKSPAVMADLIRAVAKTRAQGFALCRRNDHHVLDSLAVPLTIPGAVIPYAIGIVGRTLFSNHADVRRMATTLRSVIDRHPRSVQGIAQPASFATN